MSASIKTISARVPREIRDQGDAALKRIDSTVTDLVNAAFEYVIKTGKLPDAREHLLLEKKGSQKLTQQQKAEFTAFMQATSFAVAPEFETMSAKEIKQMRLKEKYGAGL